MRFRALIQTTGKTAAGIEVPAEVVSALGAGRKPPVRVTIAGHTFRTTVATMNGVFMVGVSNEFRKVSGVAGGQVVEIEIDLDKEPRVVSVPPDLAAALAAEPAAALAFEGLSYSNRRRLVIPIEEAKAPETRSRRIEKTVALLREGKA